MNVYFCDKCRYSSFNLFFDEKWLLCLICVCILILIKWMKMYVSCWFCLNKLVIMENRQEIYVYVNFVIYCFVVDCYNDKRLLKICD